MIKQTLHFFNKDKRKELIKICKTRLKKMAVLIIPFFKYYQIMKFLVLS